MDQEPELHRSQHDQHQQQDAPAPAENGFQHDVARILKLVF
jgi:hypothetical protein